MSSGGHDREPEPGAGAEGRAPTEEELRAAYEAQIKKVRIEHVLLEHVVTVANLGLRRTGLAAGTEDERDPDQVRLAVESIRALLPLLEQSMPDHAAQIRDALSQLQFAFVKIGGQEGEAVADQAEAGRPEPPSGSEEAPGEDQEPTARPDAAGGPGPAQKSGRLWVPGQ